MTLSLFRKVYESMSNRRENLINKMCNLDQSNINCSSCRGKCCTLMANSMRITPIEAIDMRTFLYEKWQWNDELKEKLQKCIADFRLDEHIDFGRGRSFRRTYTCPFYLNEFPGCPFPAKIKPYGCLGFNPAEGKPIDGEGCFSDMKILEEREQLVANESELNEKVREYLDLDWDKLPIPVALLAIDKKLDVMD